jgi:uncharacterized membrane protein
MHKKFVAVFSALVFASLLAVALVAVRWIYSGRPAYLFLLWNLFLAWLPPTLAVLATSLRRPRLLAFIFGAGWLLFLPNAPYLLTDLLHLGRWGGAPFWYDLLMLLVFALTGLLLGFVSLEMMRALVHERLGRLAGWLFALTALALSSIGVTIGRFLRWNSWDALLRPGEIIFDLLAVVQQPWVHRQAYVFSLGLAAVLVCAYIVLTLTPRMQAQELS